MIKRFSVRNLSGRLTFDHELHADVNVITGKNGAGKTTALKLLWYMVSANLERIFPEIHFEMARVEVDDWFLQIDVDSKTHKVPVVTFTSSLEDVPKLERIPLTRIVRDSDVVERYNQRVLTRSKRSVFFPTFRRIEGGFSIETGEISTRHGVVTWHQANELQSAVAALSKSLSVGEHRFVASISTADVSRLLIDEYAKISSKTNALHSEFATQILQRIQNRSASSGPSADQVLAEIEKAAKSVNERREQVLKPFSVLAELATRILERKGVRVSSALSLGEAAGAIASDALSAGEKQMLSFLAYNAFTTEAPVFIDEPEISLHVDWQRTLFTQLALQSNSNQFIIATHSPFIFARYSDRELMLSTDRGMAD